MSSLMSPDKRDCMQETSPQGYLKTWRNADLVKTYSVPPTRKPVGLYCSPFPISERGTPDIMNCLNDQRRLIQHDVVTAFLSDAELPF
jgi:hypothetical protein